MDSAQSLPSQSGRMQMKLGFIELKPLGPFTPQGYAVHWAYIIGPKGTDIETGDWRVYEVGLQGKSSCKLWEKMYIAFASKTDSDGNVVKDSDGNVVKVVPPRAPAADAERMAGWIGLMDLGTTDMTHDQIWQFAMDWERRHPRYIFCPGPNCQNFAIDLYKELTGEKSFPYHTSARAPMTLLLVLLLGTVIGVMIGLLSSWTTSECVWSTVLGSVVGLAIGCVLAITCRNVPPYKRRVGGEDPVLKLPGSTKKTRALRTVGGRYLKVTKGLKVQTSQEQEGDHTQFTVFERMVKEKGEDVLACYLLNACVIMFLMATNLGKVFCRSEKAAGWERFIKVERSPGEKVWLLRAHTEEYIRVSEPEVTTIWSRLRAWLFGADTVTLVAKREEATGFIFEEITTDATASEPSGRTAPRPPATVRPAAVPFLQKDQQGDQQDDQQGDQQGELEIAQIQVPV